MLSRLVFSINFSRENTNDMEESTMCFSLVVLSIKQRFDGSMIKRVPSPSWKKSIPSIGRVTSATNISCEHTCSKSVKNVFRLPKTWMRSPFAVHRLYSVESGKHFSSQDGSRTDTADLQSIKYPATKRSRFVESLGEPVTTPITDRPPRFPFPFCDLSVSLAGIVGMMFRCNIWTCQRICCDTSTVVGWRCWR